MSDTAELLAGVTGVLRRYLVLPGEHYVTAVALWTLHAHAITAADTSPRLIFKSAEKESGKTRSLELLELLVPAPLAVVNTTTAAIFRLLKDEQATVLFDEVDAVFSRQAPGNEDLRALLNAGYRRGANVARVVGEGKRMRVERFPVFAATTLAAIGDLPDTVESRGIVVPMRRRSPDEHVEPFRRRQAEADTLDVRERLKDWAERHLDELLAADPVMPDAVTDRAADCWAPLVAIADVAGADWPSRAREAASRLASGRVAEDQSIGVRLLGDIHHVLNGRDRISSAELCRALNGQEESDWGGWNGGKGISQRDLAKRLGKYGVRSHNIKFPDGTVPKGFASEDFTDTFARYLRHTSATGATNATHARAQVADVAPVARTPAEGMCLICGEDSLTEGDFCDRHQAAEDAAEAMPWETV